MQIKIDNIATDIPTAEQYIISVWSNYNVATPGNLWKMGEIKGYITHTNLELLLAEINASSANNYFNDIDLIEYLEEIIDYSMSWGKDSWYEDFYDGSAETLHTFESCYWEFEKCEPVTPTDELLTRQAQFKADKLRLWEELLVVRRAKREKAAKRRAEKEAIKAEKEAIKAEKEAKHKEVTNMLSDNGRLTGFDSPASYAIAQCLS